MGKVSGALALARRTGTWMALLVVALGVAPLRVADSPADTAQALAQSPGRALRAAIGALEAGDPERAEALLSAVARDHPIVEDYAQLLRMRLRLDQGQYRQVIALKPLWERSRSPLRSDFYAALGDAYAALRDEPAARNAWQTAMADTADRDRVATLQIASAESFERSGNPSEAAELYLRAWKTRPLQARDETVGDRLEALEQQLETPVLTASAWYERGSALLRRSRNERALEAFDRALALGGLSAAQERRAKRKRAQTLFRLRRYTEAAKAFAALPQDAETRIERARATARAGDVERAVGELEAVGKSSKGRHGARAKYLAALLLEGEDEHARARALFAGLVKSEPGSSYATASAWRLGWSAYREGRFDEAIAHFEGLADRETDPLAALRARYWQARGIERAGREGAEAIFAELGRDFPLSYYGWRARERVPVEAGSGEPVAIGPGTAALTPVDLARPAILLEAGLDGEALDELGRLFRRARGLADRLSLAELYANAGDFHSAQRLMMDAYEEPLARGPAPRQLELWWHAWPTPFAKEVHGATGGGKVPEPALVYAVMREESGYRPEVVSVSGARGLLQLMPETAERVARDTGLDGYAAPDDLFVPQANIQLGSAYLAQLLRRFSGRPSAAIGSYNAGPEAVARWIKANAAEDDEWVEAIPYDQTRSYVKRVLRSLNAYRVLY
ncbi:MAG: transglycosylase SLT domain-containing protein [Myxococcota bacterium]